MIATKEEIKALLGIDPNSCDKDSQIEAWLPQMPDMIAKHTNNFFVDHRTYESGVFVFTGADGTDKAKIELTDGLFITEGFQEGMDIYVSGSNLNDGFYEIDTLTEILLQLAGNPKIYNETVEYTTYIFRVDWPIPLKSVVASIIGDRIQDPASTTDGAVKSEKIGDYSVSYDSKLKDWTAVYKEELRPYLRPKFIKSHGGGLVNVGNSKMVYGLRGNI